MFKFKRTLLIFLILGCGGDHSHLHDRNPSQSKVRRWMTLVDKAIHSFD